MGKMHPLFKGLNFTIKKSHRKLEVNSISLKTFQRLRKTLKSGPYHIPNVQIIIYNIANHHSRLDKENTELYGIGQNVIVSIIYYIIMYK